MLVELDLFLVARPVGIVSSWSQISSNLIPWLIIMFLTHDHQLWANPTMEIDPTKIGIAGDVRLCIVYSAKLPAVPAKIIIIQIPDYPFMSHTSNCHVPTMFQSFDHNFLQNHHLFILVHHKILENQHLAPLSVLIFPIDHCSNVSPGGKKCSSRRGRHFTTGAARWLRRSIWPKPWRWAESTSRRPGYMGYIAIVMP